MSLKKPKSNRFSTHAPCKTGVSHVVYCPECQGNSTTYKGGANQPQTAPRVVVGGRRLMRIAKFPCGHSCRTCGSIYH